MTVCIPSTTYWPAGKWTDADDDALGQRDLAEVFAWRALQTLTGNRLSICPVEVRPSRITCSPNTYIVSPVTGFGRWHPYVGVDGNWYNAVHSDGCQCNSTAYRIALPGPVARVDAVVIDGVQLPATAYHVEQGFWLVRDDGGFWPLRQNLMLPVESPDAFFVRMWLGEAPDETADYIAGILAAEYLLGISGSKKCRLPSNVTMVSRQGVTYESVTSFFETGLTGINEVDAFVAAMNPSHLKMASQAWSPDTINRPRVFGTRSSTTRTLGVVEDPANPGYYTDPTIYSTGF